MEADMKNGLIETHAARVPEQRVPLVQTVLLAV
jgi:hypothetical protein